MTAATKNSERFARCAKVSIEPLALSFRAVELAAVGGSALVVGWLFWDRRSSNWHGAALIALYAGVAAAFFFAGDRG